jgi:pyruvate dehydrogenase E2 component (dihydrolipoamide acetyltransferase)
VATQTINVPDIGGSEGVEVIEVCVAPGDVVKAEDSLIVLESDKASMEVPSPAAGKVVEVKLKVGDKVSEGAAILVLEAEGSAPAESAPEKAPEKAPAPAGAEQAAEKPAPASASAGAPSVEMVEVPDIGTDDAVDVIEVSVAVGDRIEKDDTLIVLESDKASMEVPAPKGGVVRALKIKVGDKVGKGAAILELETAADEPAAAAEKPAAAAPSPAPAPAAAKPPVAEAPAAAPAEARSAPEPRGSADVYAGPAVRRLAREMAIDLTRVPGSGPKGRIQKDDIKRFVKELMEGRAPSLQGGGIPPIPPFDAAQFGEVDVQPLSKLHKLTAANMQRNWLNIPHVTQFDDADITELEAFRDTLKGEAEKRGVKLTPLPFLLKACAAALRANPKFNASLHSDGEQIVYKKYVHIGMAVDTPVGLVVPVLRDVDRKSIWEIAAETAELAARAKDRKLKPAEMQGGCFSISSLGNIGGLGFTPIINAPEVAILGVSKLTVKPQWNGVEFVPRKMLPLSLSYDHRAINGADAGRFFTFLNGLLGDIRRLIL